MDTVLAVFGAIDDPRDHTVQHEFAAPRFVSFATTSCGARSFVDVADFAAANRADLADFVDLPTDARPSYDTFSRPFRPLAPKQLEDALRRIGAAPREGLSLGSGRGCCRGGRQAPALRLRARPRPTCHR